MREVKIYTTTYCGYCVRAKQLLSQKGIPYQEIDVTGDHSVRSWLVGASGGRRTVPQIFIGDRPIGGFTELRELDRKGLLGQMLAAETPARS